MGILSKLIQCSTKLQAACERMHNGAETLAVNKLNFNEMQLEMADFIASAATWQTERHL